MDVLNKVSMLDDLFSQYIMKKTSDKDLERDLAIVLNGLSNDGKEFSISIVQNTNRKEPFFGLRIFPVTGSIDALLNEMLVPERASFKAVLNKWKSIKNWIVEIDSNVFNRKEISFTPSEITALLLHEIGHTIYSDTVVERWYRAYLENAIRLSSEDKASNKILYFLYSIPLTLNCGLRNWKVGKNDLRQEIFADASVEKLGYGESLLSALKKIIKCYGNSDTADDDAMDAAVSSSINWCSINASDLVIRKNKLKDDLYYQSVKTNSGYLKNIAYSIMKKIGISTRERYTGAVIESTIQLFDTNDFLQKHELVYDIKTFGFIERSYNDARVRATSALESTTKSKKKLTIPNQLDIDAIEIEIDRITNHMDRRYALDLIYNQIEGIEEFKEHFQYDEDLKRTYLSKMDRMLEELESMRKVVLSKRNFDKQYKVFVKYPSGYEG